MNIKDMKDMKEIVALNSALKSRFKKERDFIDYAKSIVRKILANNFNDSVLTQAGLRDIDNELQKVTKMLETNEPFETSAKLADVVEKTLDNATQLPAPNAKDQGKQDNSRSEPKPKGADPYAHYYNSEDNRYEIPDSDGNIQIVVGLGDKINGVKRLTPAQVNAYVPKRGGRKSRRLRRTKF